MPRQKAAMKSVLSKKVKELTAIAASVAANCEVCFKYHYAQARELGVSREDVVETVELANQIKQAPDKKMLELVDRVLGTNLGSPER